MSLDLLSKTKVMKCHWIYLAKLRLWNVIGFTFVHSAGLRLWNDICLFSRIKVME